MFEDILRAKFITPGRLRRAWRGLIDMDPAACGGSRRARVLRWRGCFMTYTMGGAAEPTRRSQYLVLTIFILTLEVAVAQPPAPTDLYRGSRLIMVRDQIEARGVKNSE